MSESVFAHHWHVDEILSDGDTATVYGVRHRRGRRGALKVWGDRQSESSFVREVSHTDGASLAGSPELLAYGASEGMRYLIVDRVGGETLAAHSGARAGRFDLATALLIAERLAAIVERVHALGIVHRDVQPSNVLISDYGEIKLIDFSHAARSSDDLHDVALPASAFAAPEQRSGDADPLDVRGDVFGVGALLYWMLTGALAPLRRLADGSDLMVSLDELGHLPLEVVDLVDAAVTREPHRRIASATRLRRKLAGVREGSNGLVFIERDPNLNCVAEDSC
jgi:eukaryotic-like serine/threonine-protein kinase